ncbi:MAG: DUF2877 domain-containing protein [Eubacteriales bacterium]|nr:DUF2877 domain-containing protein [Eubacteriales bacterium]
MYAAAVCQRLFALSQGQPRCGTVHSVFAHAVNLEFGEPGLIGLIAQEKALTPYAVSVRTVLPLVQAGVRAGMVAYLQEGMLRIPQAQIEIDFSGAKQRDLSLDSIELCDAEPFQDTLQEQIVTQLDSADAEAGLVSLATGGAGNHYTCFLKPRLETLFAAVSQNAYEKAAQAAANCAGCGMGLTPSSDDLLCGYFATLHLLLRAQKLLEAKSHIRDMAKAAAEKTNRISTTFLLQSGDALANDAICDLFRSATPCFDASAANRAIARVLAIGSTSGADMLTGVVLALRQNIGGNVHMIKAEEDRNRFDHSEANKLIGGK